MKLEPTNKAHILDISGNGTTFARSKTEGSKKKKSDTALEIVWICGEYMSEDYLGHFGPFR